MVLYIEEECGIPCFSLAVTEGQMSIRTAEVQPYYFFFALEFLEAIPSVYQWRLCTKLPRSVFSFLLLSFWTLVDVIAVIVLLYCFTYCFTRYNTFFHHVDPPDCYFAVIEGSPSSSSSQQPSSPSRHNAQATDKPEKAVGKNSSNKPGWPKLAIPSFRVGEPNSTRAKDEARKSVTIAVENTTKEPRRVREGPGGQICLILQRQ